MLMDITLHPDWITEMMDVQTDVTLNALLRN